MIGILSTIAPPFDLDQIKSQALWAATQAVLIINEHKVRNAALAFPESVLSERQNYCCSRYTYVYGIPGVMLICL